MSKELLFDYEIEAINAAIASGLSIERNFCKRIARAVETYEIHQDRGKVRSLSLAYQNGENIPPIHCTSTGKLLDGHHRLLGKTEVFGWDTHMDTIEYPNELYNFVKESFDFPDIDFIEMMTKYFA